MINFLEVVSVSEEKQDKNGRTFKSIKFATPKTITKVDEATGEVIKMRTQRKYGTMNAYEESYLNGQEEFGFDFEQGEVIAGSIETRNVAPYQIGERTVNMYSCVVLGESGKDDWEHVVERAFKSAGHEIVSSTPIDAQPKERVALIQPNKAEFEDDEVESEEPVAQAEEVPEPGYNNVKF